MQELFDAITIGDLLGGLTLIGAVLAGIKWVKPAILVVRHFVDAWNGEPARPGVQARPGVMEQLADLTTEIAELRQGVGLAQTLAKNAAESSADAAFHSKPNHGHSSYDDLVKMITRLQTASADTKTAIDTSLADRADILARLDDQSEQIRAIITRLDTTGDLK